jgi:hypothetical protein
MTDYLGFAPPRRGRVRTLAQPIAVTGNPNPLPPRLASPDAEPRTMMSWALHWGALGLRVFPAAFFTGTPLVNRWAKDATNKDHLIIEWWSETPNADIGCIPDAAGCYVVVAVGDEGFDSLVERETMLREPPLLVTDNSRNRSIHLWFPGRASSHRWAAGLYVFGVGSYLYMPASFAPDPIYRADLRETA